MIALGIQERSESARGLEYLRPTSRGLFPDLVERSLTNQSTQSLIQIPTTLTHSVAPDARNSYIPHSLLLYQTNRLINPLNHPEKMKSAFFTLFTLAAGAFASPVAVARDEVVAVDAQVTLGNLTETIKTYTGAISKSTSIFCSLTYLYYVTCSNIIKTSYEGLTKQHNRRHCEQRRLHHPHRR